MVLSIAGCKAADPHTRLVARYIGHGEILARVTGPGPTPDSERIYLSYTYQRDTLEIVAVDPDTGHHQVFANPATREDAAWAMAAAPDGCIYIGTARHAHVLRLDPRTSTLSDLGQPVPGESYIWGMTVGSNGKVYGCTFPNAHLFQLDPATSALRDLGRMDPTEQYARWIAAGDDGLLYIGIGMHTAHLVAYQIATGEHRDLLPPQDQVTGVVKVYRGDDEHIHAVVMQDQSRPVDQYQLAGWNLIPEPAPAKPHKLPMKQGRVLEDVIQDADDRLRVWDPASNGPVEKSITYPGRPLEIYRLCLGPDGKLYGNTDMPIHFLQIDPAGKIRDLGLLGTGECYSYLSRGQALLIAAYGARAPLMIYDPARPISRGTAPNPRPVSVPGNDRFWRPMAMIAGPDNKVYIGAVAGYGRLGGPMAVWDVDAGSVQLYNNIVQDQSVVSLTAAGNLIVGGTTVKGGGGSRATASDARLFVWNTATSAKELEITPVPGAQEITDLVTAPNGIVYGIAGQNTLFGFDPHTGRVTTTSRAPFSQVVYNSAILGPDGKIWGLADTGVFSIDPATGSVRLAERTPEKITGGAALAGNKLYYASLSAVYCYTLPHP